MVTAAAAAALVGWFAKNFPNINVVKVGKWLAGSAVALALAWGLWSAYSWAADRGAAAENTRMQVFVDAANKARDEAQNELAEYKTQYENWTDGMQDAQRALDAAHKEKVALLEAKLAAANQRATEKKVIYNEIPVYIPAEIDGAVELPLGFISLYDQALQGKAASAASLGDISFGAGGNVGSPSGVTLSEFAHVAVFNNIEAVQRGVIVDLWQEWYRDTKHNFDEATRKGAEHILELQQQQAAPQSVK